MAIDILDNPLKEEITDLDTFLSLDNNDFTRLQLTIKMMKIIQKYQKQYGVTIDITTTPNEFMEETDEGKQIHETLTEGIKPDEVTNKKINRIICDWLADNYGAYISVVHKRKKVMLAKSLVKTYPILASNVSDVPYAAWFHKGGRGAGRHAGSIIECKPLQKDPVVECSTDQDTMNRLHLLQK
ncbi:uncharacterized protein LOC121601278 [Anopheles merus]|uniref:uncharacterized protein LOC121601278 n=1 Tax=Anopheles merus TaxID=30066 RepID=UPI001BE4D470|nr:uncharacterized protein LOC121601278 [Anopheles merus]